LLLEAKMNLILKETIDTLGEEGDIVKVKDGYGRNYLIPYGKAVQATSSNITILEKERASIEARKLGLRSDAEALAKKIAGVTITIEQRVGDENRLFGSVTSNDIAQKLAELGIKIDRKKIILDEPIKTIGTKMVPIKVGYQVNADVKVEVVPLTSAE
jgi:large subunit ribosomal protein L9